MGIEEERDEIKVLNLKGIQFLSGFTVTTEASGNSESDLDEQENEKTQPQIKGLICGKHTAQHFQYVYSSILKINATLKSLLRSTDSTQQ